MLHAGEYDFGTDVGVSRLRQPARGRPGWRIVRNGSGRQHKLRLDRGWSGGLLAEPNVEQPVSRDFVSRRAVLDDPVWRSDAVTGDEQSIANHDASRDACSANAQRPRKWLVEWSESCVAKLPATDLLRSVHSARRTQRRRVFDPRSTK